jgi:hypothetical protein
MGVYIQCPRLTCLKAEWVAEMLGYGGRERREFEDWSGSYGNAVLSKKKGQFSLLQHFKDPKTDRPLSNEELWAEGFFMTWAGTNTLLQIHAMSAYLNLIRI